MMCERWLFIFCVWFIVFVIWHDGYTPLLFAGNRGHLSVAQFLLSAHADVNQAGMVSKLKVSKLYNSLVEELFILFFNHGDGDGDDDLKSV